MNTGKIPYKNKAREAQRQARMVQLRAKVAARLPLVVPSTLMCGDGGMFRRTRKQRSVQLVVKLEPKQRPRCVNVQHT